jgi:hypothetical protein
MLGRVLMFNQPHETLHEGLEFSDEGMLIDCGKTIVRDMINISPRVVGRGNGKCAVSHIKPFQKLLSQMLCLLSLAKRILKNTYSSAKDLSAEVSFRVPRFCSVKSHGLPQDFYVLP